MNSPAGPARSSLRDQLAPPRIPVLIVFRPLAWRSVLYCATAALSGFLALLGVLALPWACWATSNIERWRLTLLGLPRPPAPARAQGRHPWDPAWYGENNFTVWVVTVLFAAVSFGLGLVLTFLVIGPTFLLYHMVGELDPLDLTLLCGGLALGLIAGLYATWALAAGQAAIVDQQLRRQPDLSRQVDELTTSRRELVDVFATERRQIERDLHDGTQQHLVLLSMQLGEADYALSRGRLDDARDSLDGARNSIETAMESLRQTVRGIHPQILTDHGLEAAVRELAARQPVPVEVVAIGGRPPAEHLALAAYYLVSESFTNAAKYAGATAMTVRLILSEPFEVEVSDDGRGGAVVQHGHGLSGIIERVRALGGDCWVSSPPGGPTLIRARFPGGEPQ